LSLEPLFNEREKFYKFFDKVPCQSQLNINRDEKGF